MYKPDNWETTEAKNGGEFERPSAGGHVLKIVRAVEAKAKESGRDQLNMSADIAGGEFKDYYKDLSVKLNKDCYLTAYWGLDEKSLPYFKGNIKSIEQSNNGFKFDFDENKLVGKLVGACLREEEYEDRDGNLKSSMKILFCCPIADVPNLKVPNKKELSKGPKKTAQFFSDGAPIPPQDDLPF